MLEVRKTGRAAAGGDPTSAQNVDRKERRPAGDRVDRRSAAAVIKDARAYQLLWELVERIETIEAVGELAEIDRRLRKKHGIRG